MKTIIFSDEQYQKLKSHLIPGDGLEALSICLARQVRHIDGEKLIVLEINNIPYDQCERSEQNLTWYTENIVSLLDKAESQNLSIIKIHSHPFGPRAFSLQDDRSDRVFFPSVQSWCESDNLHCSLIFTPDFILGRAFDKNGRPHPIDKIFVIGERIRLFRAKSGNVTSAFDEETYAIFRELRAGVVGCSGTGGWTVELLGRNQIGRLGLCDHDILKKPNLTRVVNSKFRFCDRSKVDVAAEAVIDMGLGTQIDLMKCPVHTRQAIELLKSYDVIFGCVDSIFARHVLNLLCTYYSIPYFDLGVHISADEKELTSVACGYHYIQPGKSSLLSRGVFSSKELADETYQLRSPELFERLQRDGYVRGRKVARPAVSAINCLAAASCFEEFQSQILDYRDDKDLNVAAKHFCAKSGEEFLHHEEDYEVDLVLKKLVGRGDSFFRDQRHLLFGDENNAQPENQQDGADI